jgi:hypothetical protein
MKLHILISNNGTIGFYGGIDLSFGLAMSTSTALPIAAVFCFRGLLLARTGGYQKQSTKAICKRFKG